jgi:hypothetical protein
MLRLAPLVLLLAAACSDYPDAPPPGPYPAQPTTSAEPLSERRVAYRLSAELSDDARTLTGTMQVRWTNPDAVPVDSLYWHLYLNAFRPQSAWIDESGGEHRGNRPTGEDPWGGVAVTRIAQGQTDLTGRLAFAQTTSRLSTDSTVAVLPLPSAVAPGDSVVLDVAFTARLPLIFARTGYAETASGAPFVMAAQWFPKLAVYEEPGRRYVPASAPRGRWSAHAFHEHSEFYADFGTYDVTLSVPEAYVVGATGVRVSERRDGTRAHLRYLAHDVHDFAWTASPAYRAFESRWEHVHLRLLIQPEHAGQADRYFAAARVALAELEEMAGAYPYTTLTLVDAVGDANGMEYPTLVTLGTGYGAPPWVRLPELVTVHEIGHQYFQGMLASNEAEEAWLDEGITSYAEMKIMDRAWDGSDGRGSFIDLPGVGLSNRDLHQIGALSIARDGGRAAVADPTWDQRWGYGGLVYSKPAMILASLEAMLGEQAMRDMLRTYASEWRFRHPTTDEFVETAARVSGNPDVRPFLTAALHTRAVLDDSLSLTPMDGGARLHVVRKGTLPFGRAVALSYADGRTDTLRLGPTAALDTLLATPPTAARLDAAPLDITPANDAATLRPDAGWARKLHLKAAQAVHLALAALTSL